MALWTFTDNKGGVAWHESGVMVSNWDDGLAFKPGDDEFRTDLADTKAATLGAGVKANYSGTPNWHLRVEAEQKAEAESARLAELEPPE